MRTYLKLIAILVVGTLLMSGPWSIIILMLTGGLTMPLVFSSAALVYVLALLPAVYLWDEGRASRGLGIAVSLTAALVIAVLPGVIAERNATESSRPLFANDHKAPASLAARSIEIRRPKEDYDGVFADRNACGDECQHLLRSGQADWIRVIMVDPFGKESDYTFFKGLRGKDCAVPGTTASDSASCAVMAPDTGQGADLVLVFPKRESVKEKTVPSAPVFKKRGAPAPREPDHLYDLFEWQGQRRAVAFRRSGNELKEVYQQTDVKIGIVGIPLLLMPIDKGMRFVGLGFAKRTRHLNPITFAQVIGDLGYTLPSAQEGGAPKKTPKTWRDGIDDDMTRGLLAVLELPGVQPFNTEQAKVVFDWVMHARQTKVWTSDLIGLLKRIAADSRITRPTYFDQIFERNRDVTIALLPVILDEIERRGINDDYTVPRQCAYTFSRIDPSLLKPYADRILKLFEMPGRVKEILLPVAGRLGADPTTIVTPLSADLDQESRGQNGRAIAACLADKSRASTLIPLLRQEVKATPTAGRLKWEIKAHRQWLLRALANLGDMAFVREQLTAPAADERDAKENERVLKLIDRATSSPRRPDEVCYGSTY